jgi:hypothetical protein
MSRAVEEKAGPTGLVSWYLMAGLLYYHFNESILSDGRYDEIAKILKEAWPGIVHDHKNFITEADLEAGTLLLKPEEFPVRTRMAAYAILTSIAGRDKDKVIYDRLYGMPFLPPEPLRNNATLYNYSGTGKSWLEVQRELGAETPVAVVEAPVVVRSRTRPPVALPVAPVTDPEAPVVRIRVRVPQIVVAEPEIRVRTRVRPS